MKVELRKISDIKPYPGNPRINDSAVDAVARSLKEFGFRQPIVIDTDGVIVCGHTRWKAAQKLGLEKVPVHVAKEMAPWNYVNLPKHWENRGKDPLLSETQNIFWLTSSNRY